jgi:hypothetical protein
MARKSALSPDPAARAMAELLRDITGSARKPLETPDITDSVAIHDFRKAFKRWRAALRLIAPVVGEEAEAMRIAARDLAREMAHARDGAAALEALSDLGDNVPTLSARSRATIEGRLTLLGANAEAASLTPDFKLRIAALLDQAAAAIQRWPIGEFDCEQATRQLTATYRRVRDSEPEDWSTAPAEALRPARRPPGPSRAVAIDRAAPAARLLAFAARRADRRAPGGACRSLTAPRRSPVRGEAQGFPRSNRRVVETPDGRCRAEGAAPSREA